MVRRIFTDRAGGTDRPGDLPPAQRRPGAISERQADLGTLHAVPAAAQRGLHRPGLLQPHRDRPRPTARPDAPGRSREPARTGSRSTVPPIVTDEMFEAAGEVVDRQQPSGARAAPNQAQWLLRGWSGAAPAEWAPTATRCAAATAPGTGTTTAATTTRCAPAAKTVAAPNETSAPTRWTSSCSTRSNDVLLHPDLLALR